MYFCKYDSWLIIISRKVCLNYKILKSFNCVPQTFIEHLLLTGHWSSLNCARITKIRSFKNIPHAISLLTDCYFRKEC